MPEDQLPNQTPMIDTDNNAVYVPSGQTQAQLAKGYKYGAVMADTEGTKVVVPHDRMSDVLTRGYKPWVDPMSKDQSSAYVRNLATRGMGQYQPPQQQKFSDVMQLTPQEEAEARGASVKNIGSPPSPHLQPDYVQGGLLKRPDEFHPGDISDVAGLQGRIRREQGKAIGAANEQWTQYAGGKGADVAESLIKFGAKNFQDDSTATPGEIGVARSIGKNVAGTLADPTTYAAGTLGGTGKVAQVGLSALFGVGATKSSYDAAGQLGSVWDRNDISRQQKVELGTDLVINTLVGGIAGAHAVKAPFMTGSESFLSRIPAEDRAAVAQKFNSIISKTGGVLSKATTGIAKAGAKAVGSAANAFDARTMEPVHNALASLLDPRAGKEDTFANAKTIAGDVLNEAARQGVSKGDFKGREGNQLGVKLIDDTIKSHTDFIDSKKTPYLQDKIDLTPLAKEMESKITTEMRKDAPSQAKAIQDEADLLKRTGTVSELDDFRDRTGDDLNAWYKKGETEQLASSALVKAKEAAVRKSREMLYEHVGNKAGIDPAYMRNMAIREADLIDARTDITKKVNKASADTASAEARTTREKLFGVKGKVDFKGLPGRVTDTALQGLPGVGMSPVDTLNARFKTIFGRRGMFANKYQPQTYPPAPGGIPPTGPQRLALPPHNIELGPSSMETFANQTVRNLTNEARLRAMRNKALLPEGTPPATQLGPSSLPEQKMLPPASTQDITLHQPPVEAPMQITPAGKMSGRDVDTGRFKRGYTTGPQPPDQPITQYPGVLQKAITKPAPESVSQKRFDAIMKDIENAAAKRQSPQEPVTVKDSVFQHIKDAQKAQGATETPAVAPEATGAQEPLSEKRVQYPDFRAEFDKLDDNEKVRGHFMSENTDLPNLKAFNVAERNGKAGAVARSDVDGLNAMNEKHGYEAGTAILKAKTNALKEAGLEAYHDKGDEFIYRGDSEGELKTKLEHARNILRDTVFEVTAPDGTVRYYKGADFSYGTGKDLSTAEAGQHIHKTVREAAGERKRGELRGITEVTKGGDKINKSASAK